VTENEIVELGVRAQLLLTSETFRKVVSHLGDQYANLILTSAPNEGDKREDGYHQHRALNDIVTQLNLYVGQKDQILEQRKMAEQEEEPLDEDA